MAEKKQYQSFLDSLRESDDSIGFRATCEEVIADLPPNAPYNLFLVVTQARLRQEQGDRLVLTTIASRPFNSVSLRD